MRHRVVNHDAQPTVRIGPLELFDGTVEFDDLLIVEHGKRMMPECRRAEYQRRGHDDPECQSHEWLPVERKCVFQRLYCSTHPAASIRQECGFARRPALRSRRGRTRFIWESLMRVIILAVAAAVLAAAPAQAAWKSFKYPQYAFGVDFPGEPKMGKGEYRGVIAGRMATTTMSAEQDGTIYQVEMVDFSNRLAETPVLLEEAVFLATQDGKLVSDVTARTDNGVKYAKYGRP